MASSTPTNKKGASVTVLERKGSDDGTDNHLAAPSIRTPRTARFAEATSVNSPIEPTAASRAPWHDEESTHFKPEPQPGDIGFGYINDRRSQADVQHVEMPATPGGPLKSALKSPGAQSRFGEGLKSPMFIDESVLKSPTWREEKLLEKREERTEKTQRQDLKVKVRVRVAKFMLRLTNFSCSLIVLSMLATTLTIFNASKDLPARNSLPAWAPQTPKWPQMVVLVIACVSLFASVVIILAMCRGGRRMAQKWQTYYTVASVTFFSFSIVMWAIGAGILQHSKSTGDGKDMWGWSCKQNNRQKIFQSDVDYNLLCRLQNWSLVCCLIEVVVETITILVYGIIFYRFWSKRKLRNTMAARDKARSELYMSQIRSGANTPYATSFANGALSPPLPYQAGQPLSPREGGYNPLYSPRFAPGASDLENGPATASIPQQDQKFASLSGAIAATTPAPTTTATAPAPAPKTTPSTKSKQPFVLQAPPTKKQANAGQSPTATASPTFSFVPTPSTAYTSTFETQSNSRPVTPKPLGGHPTEHAPAVPAPGEQTYAPVPIPGAYTAMGSPGVAR